MVRGFPSALVKQNAIFSEKVRMLLPELESSHYDFFDEESIGFRIPVQSQQNKMKYVSRRYLEWTVHLTRHSVASQLRVSTLTERLKVYWSGSFRYQSIIRH